MSKLHIVLSEKEDKYFLINRLSLGQALLDMGCKVTVVASETGYRQRIESLGFGFSPLQVHSGGVSMAKEIRLLFTYWNTYRPLQADLIHQFTPRPVIYGSLAARFLPRIALVNSLTGLGYVFIHPGKGKRLLRVVSLLYRLALSHPRSRLIAQNPDDLKVCLDSHWTRPENANLVPGSGVDCRRFCPAPEPAGPLRVVLAGRLLWDKGVAEFVEAARSLGGCTDKVRFVLVGDGDDTNPTTIPPSQIEQWQKEGVIEWDGFQEDMPSVYRNSHIVVLPSYREGFPKSLLEAAACARPLVGTDVPGVRQVIRNQVNGHLVPARNSDSLAHSIRTLLEDRELRHSFGLAGRKIAEEHSSEKIAAGIVAVYRQLLPTLA